MSTKSTAETPEELVLRTPTIALSQVLKFAGWCESGGEAKHAIQQGQVQVDGVVERVVRKQLTAGVRVSYAAQHVVLRAAPSA
jgi:ribosome-associated protein